MSEEGTADLSTPAPATARVAPEPVLPVRAAEDTDRAWGGAWRESDDSNDERLLRDKPPHWS